MAPYFPWIQSPTRTYYFVVLPYAFLNSIDVELAAFEADIVATCAEHMQSHWKDDDYRACVSIESKESKYFIKFDDPTTLGPESRRGRTSTTMPCITGMGHAFPRLYTTSKLKKAFLVMEHIKLTHPSLITNLAERTAQALDWPSKVSAPSEDVMGPLGGGLIRYRFFKDNKAPLAFSGIDALERYITYMNVVRRCLYFF